MPPRSTISSTALAAKPRIASRKRSGGCLPIALPAITSPPISFGCCSRASLTYWLSGCARWHSPGPNSQGFRPPHFAPSCSRSGGDPAQHPPRARALELSLSLPRTVLPCRPGIAFTVKRTRVQPWHADKQRGKGGSVPSERGNAQKIIKARMLQAPAHARRLHHRKTSHP